jgi:hypothetical protein
MLKLIIYSNDILEFKIGLIYFSKYIIITKCKIEKNKFYLYLSFNNVLIIFNNSS